MMIMMDVLTMDVPRLTGQQGTSLQRDHLTDLDTQAHGVLPRIQAHLYMLLSQLKNRNLWMMTDLPYTQIVVVPVGWSHLLLSALLFLAKQVYVVRHLLMPRR